MDLACETSSFLCSDSDSLFSFGQEDDTPSFSSTIMQLLESKESYTIRTRSRQRIRMQENSQNFSELDWISDEFELSTDRASELSDVDERSEMQFCAETIQDDADKSLHGRQLSSDSHAMELFVSVLQQGSVCTIWKNEHARQKKCFLWLQDAAICWGGKSFFRRNPKKSLENYSKIQISDILCVSADDNKHPISKGKERTIYCLEVTTNTGQNIKIGWKSILERDGFVEGFARLLNWHGSKSSS
mmetsp:Transcript_33178/g.43717  ORF Transcript_33178/g.43717 Transcript_33178/m.43717 type:complete len:245 (+) Transcript_33178:117-851(+)